MHTPPTLSLIVPTRNRPGPLRRFLDSVARTASDPETIEVVLVIDNDDRKSAAVRHPLLTLKHVNVPPGLTMGSLNMEGYGASAGRYLMLLNDDVVARTPRWDEQVLACMRRFPDDIVLVHVNDTLLRENLCTFPLLSRTFCELAGGICPREYVRYRIDDHIEDVFNLLAFLGHSRSVYLPDVVFEHFNAVDHPQAGRIYQSAPDILAIDAPQFDALFAARKEFALRLVDHIEGKTNPAATAARRAMLGTISDPFALRIPGRQQVVRHPWWRRAVAQARHPDKLWHGGAALLTRAWDCVRRKGVAGLAQAVGRRIARFPSARHSVDHFGSAAR
jgi:glycosyltransferase involved in cell wall biosynthesis